MLNRKHKLFILKGFNLMEINSAQLIQEIKDSFMSKVKENLAKLWEEAFESGESIEAKDIKDEAAMNDMSKEDQEITTWLKKYNVSKYEIVDGVVNVDGDVKLSDKGIDTLEVKFGEVSGNFDIAQNKLKDLKNTPSKVGGSFIANDNLLSDLSYSPKEVGGNFVVSRNNLTSLKGAPVELDGDFDVSHNKLTNIKYAPKNVGGKFNCSNNEITALDGSLETVGKDLDASFNDIKTLKTSLKAIAGDFWLVNNKTKFTEDDVLDKIVVKGQVKV